MPVLARLQSEYQSEGLQVLAINMQSSYYSLEEWATFMKQFAPVGMGQITESLAVQDVNDQAAGLYQLTALGTEILLDGEGQVVVRSDGPMGYRRLRSKVEEVVGMQTGTAPSAKPISQLGTDDYHALALAPGNPDIAFFGHHGGILRSSDGGKTWGTVPGLSQDAMNLAVSHESPQVMYLAGHDVFMRSEDGGQTWRNVENNLPGLDLHWFAMRPDGPSWLYTFAVGSGLFKSADGGTTWTPWSLPIPGEASVTAIVVLGGDPLRVLAGDEDGNVFLSADDGASWEQVGSLGSAALAMALNPDAGSIYAGTSGSSVYRSQDDGRTWTRLPIVTTVAALAAGGSGTERVLVVSDAGEVFRSDDGGKTW